MRRRFWAFLVAALVLIVLGTAAQSYRVQEAWSTAAETASALASAAIPLGDRLRWMAHDVVGLLDSYGALSALTLLIALLIAGAVTRWSGHRTLVFGLAGASGMLLLFTVLKAVLGTVGVFGARGFAGHAAQALAGMVAALLFARLTATRSTALPGQGS